MATDTAPASAAAETPPAAPSTAAPEVDFDDQASVLAAIARAETGDMAHPKASPRSRRAPKVRDDGIRGALAEPVPEGGEEEAEEPPVETGEGEPGKAPQQAAAAVTEPTRRMLQHYHLPPPRDGETEDQAFGRIRAHDAGRWSKHERERRALEGQVGELNQRFASIEPIMRAWAEEKAAAAREAQMAARPDPEAQSDEYTRLRVDELHQRFDQRERAEQERQRQEAIYAAEEERMGALLDVDEQNVAELEQGLAQDERLRRAHHFVSGIMYRDAARTFDTATPEELAEFVNNTHILNMRQLRARGLSPRQALLEMMDDVQSLLGGTAASANGNGHASAAKPAATGSPTAERIQREAAAAAARRPVSSASRAGGPSGTALDISKITDPDELFKLLKSGKITDDMIQAQLGQPART